ncbi:MAG: VWA domain-containing protein [Bifidobacteriaceae bacterium]|jgi:hypothetical protein|nr:VWA domain-containing protein [Bifidobacteriaceae bacterium]
MMTFANPTFAIIGAAAILAIIAFVIYKSADASDKKFVITETAFSDHAIADLKKIYFRYKALAASGIVIMVISALCLAGRPVIGKTGSENYSNNDIELCLDVSGSTLAYDKGIINFYQSLVSSFSGQRIGLTIFNSTARQVFPLTTDYTLAKERLDTAADAFKNINDKSSLDNLTETDLEKLALFTKGTSTNSAANSLIGDGLASCVFSFGSMGDNNSLEEKGRDKTIVFATDNALAGNPIYTLDSAMNLAKQNEIKLESIYLSSTDSENVDNSDNMHALTNKYAGDFYNSSDPKMIGSIVDSINKQTNSVNNNEYINYIDFPEIFVALLFLGLALYIFATYKINE